MAGALIAPVAVPRPVAAFCGFYVAQADAKLYNHSSQVVIARDGDRTVVTLANDFRGDVKEFALVVPVPVVLQKDQVHVGEKAWIEHLDAFSAPRLVEFNDPDPCPHSAELHVRGGRGGQIQYMVDGLSAAVGLKAGVRVEAAFTVDEYDIVILSATESGALLRWLQGHGYRVPARAQTVLGIYLKQGLKFFVAKVNLKEQARLGFKSLRPLQMAYESPRFMLPIRLGMVNADGPQELFVYTLTPHGRVEPVNYRMVKTSAENEVPLYVKPAFSTFARAVFNRQVAKEGMRTVFLEHAWNAGWCDPCAGPPLGPDELRQLGVSWLGDDAQSRGRSLDVIVTRLHARYDAASFPEDIVFQETANAEGFQVRYIMRNPFKGDCNCPQGDAYRRELIARRERQRDLLASLTGWSASSIGARMADGDDAYLPAAYVPPKPWWQKLWAR